MNAKLFGIVTADVPDAILQNAIDAQISIVLNISQAAITPIEQLPYELILPFKFKVLKLMIAYRAPGRTDLGTLSVPAGRICEVVDILGGWWCVFRQKRITGEMIEYWMKAPLLCGPSQ